MTWRLREWAQAVPEILVALPLIIYTVVVLHSGWYPQGDTGDIAIKSWDALHGHAPLLGHLTTSGVGGGAVSNHPGPIQNYLLAPFLVLSGGHPWGLIVGSALLMILTVVGCVRVARWRGGPGLATWVGGLLLILELVIGRVLVTPWNPFPAIFCLLLSALAAWSLLDRDPRGWVPLILAGSVATQGHLSLLLPVIVLAVIVATGCVRGPRPPLTVRVAAVCGGFALLAWAPVMVDLLVNHPSNLQRLFEVASTDPTPRLGFAAALSAVTYVLGPGPLDLVATSRLLSHFGSDPTGAFMASGPLGLILRPGTWVLLALLTYAVRRFRAGPQRPKVRRRLTPLLVWAALAVAAIIASAQINVPESDGGQSRSLYVAFFAPTLLCAPLLLWWSRRRRMGQGLPALGGRVAAYVGLVVVAALAVFAAPDSAWPGVRDTAGSVGAGVRTALQGRDCPSVAVDIVGDLGALAETPAVFSLITEGHEVYVPRLFNRDTDNTFRDLSRAPDDACQIRIDGQPAASPMQAPPAADGWKVVTVVEHPQASFGAPAGRFVIATRP